MSDRDRYQELPKDSKPHELSKVEMNVKHQGLGSHPRAYQIRVTEMRLTRAQRRKLRRRG